MTAQSNKGELKNRWVMLDHAVVSVRTAVSRENSRQTTNKKKDSKQLKLALH